MKKEKKKREKNKGILNKAKITFLVPIISFIFTRSVHGDDMLMPEMYNGPPPSAAPELPAIISSLMNIFASILLTSFVLMIVAYIIIFKRRKQKKKWPKVALIIFSIFFTLSLIAYFIAFYYLDYLENMYYW